MATIDVVTEMTGTVWKVLVTVGQSVGEDETVIIIESMKMEIPVLVSEPGTVAEILIAEGDMVSDGDVVMRLTSE